MNHRKLHLLKPTVYSYPHSNPQLVKTGLIYCRLSPALNSARRASGLWCRSWWGEQWMGSSETQGFSPRSLPRVFLEWGNWSSFNTTQKATFLRWRTVSNLWQNILHSSYTNACSSKELTFWRGQCQWGMRGGWRCLTDRDEWGEETRSFFLLSFSFLFVSTSLSPSLTSLTLLSPLLFP